MTHKNLNISHICEMQAASLRYNQKDLRHERSRLTLQKFEELLKEGQRDGTVTVISKTIETDNTFKL